MTATLTWWGHSTSTWQDGDTTVLFDPVLTARLGHLRRVRGPVPAPHAAHADFVLISHLHADHAHLPSLRLIPASAVLIVPAGSRRLFKPVTARGVTLYEVEPGDLAQFGGLRISVLAADHDGRRHAGSPHRGPALGYLVDGHHRCWYPGDTVRNSRSTRWRTSTSPSCQSEAGGLPLAGAISMPDKRLRRSAARIQSMLSRALGNMVAHRPSATA